MLRLFLLFLIVTAIALAQNLQADDKSKKEKELSELQQRIGKLRKTIEVKENSRSSYNRQLRQIEKQIGQISNQIRKSSRSIKRHQKKLNRLQKNKQSIQKSILNHQNDISRQMHAAYTLGQQEQIKLLFSQQDASKLQRNLTFYQYFANFRLLQIERAEQDYQKLLDNEKKIQLAKFELEKVLSEQKTQKNKLDKDRKKREGIVAELEKELKKQGNFLSHLEENAENLKQLINSLSEILSESTPERREYKKFAQLKGKLAWPVKGKVKKLYGRLKPPSNLRWQGVVINAPSGNNVRAVSHGRVAFADWLRGMGNLVIIDHGEGYLSLYGHNESLFKEAGEWVEAGDIIGSIGNSGGQKQPGLYFEIRQKGKPRNPTAWCHVRNWFAT